MNNKFSENLKKIRKDNNLTQKEFADKYNKDCVVVNTLEEAVKCAYSISNEGDTILLSPACASWDQFPDFEKRGETFKNTVNSLE